MNNKEYMEYEGYRVIEAALLSYTSPAGSLLSAAPGNHGLVWDYILFRLYLAEKTIRRFPSGFGCMDEMASGLREGLSHLPLTLRTLSLLKNLEGSSLILGIGSLPDEGKVKQRFHEFHELERACSGSMEKMVASLASLSGCRADRKLISYLSAETKAFLSPPVRETFLPYALPHLPGGQKIHSFPSCFCRRSGGRFLSFCPAHRPGPELSGDAPVNPLSKTKRLEYNENIGK